jgi:hypothetical protein
LYLLALFLPLKPSIIAGIIVIVISVVVVIGGGRDVFAVITIVRIFIGVVIAQLIVSFAGAVVSGIVALPSQLSPQMRPPSLSSAAVQHPQPLLVVRTYALSGTGTLLHHDRLSFGRRSPSR